MPTMLRQLLAGQREIRLGRLDTRRDLTFVADTVDGFVRAADGRRASTAGRSSSAPGGRRAIGEVFELARRLTGQRRDGRRSTRRGCGRTPARCWCSSPTRRSPASCWAGRPRRRSRTAWRRRSSGCGASPTPSRTRPVSSSEPRIALAEPTIGGNARRYLDECLSSNFVSSIGPFVTRFEEAFAAFVGTRYAVACASGTAAIHLALLVLDVGAGRRGHRPEPDLRRVGQPGPVRGRDAVFVDSEAETYNLDPALVVGGAGPAGAGRGPAARGDRGRAPAGPSGRHWSRSIDAAERHGVPVIEDASEALGATYRDGPARRPPGRRDRSGRLLQLQRQQAHHHRRRRDAGDRRRGARQARPPPLDPGAAARGSPTTTTRSATTTACRTSAPPWASPSWSRSTALLAGRRANAAFYDAAIGRSARASCRPRGRRGPTRRSGSTRPPWLRRALGRPATTCSRRSTAQGIDARPIWRRSTDAAVARRRAHRRRLRGRHLRAGVLPALDVEPR